MVSGQPEPYLFQFMRGIMDECTHLKNYDVPVDTNLIYIVIAGTKEIFFFKKFDYVSDSSLISENDAYQPREGIAALPDIWPGSHLRYIEGSNY